MKKKISKLSGESLDIKGEQIEKLKALFPQAVKDGEVDFDVLKQILGSDIVANGERYGLSWAGKSDCFGHIQQGTTATLKPVREESVDFDDTENLFIEGDNLEILKVLQKSYYGKIKMIYIDPPYNTGNDSFIYPDRFQESKEDYLQRIGDKDVEGNLMKDGFFRKNRRDAGHFHSNWLSMMYPRLFLARNLLCGDGIIFISIDDNEVHNLKMIMNEVFGEETFIEQVVWKNKYGAGAKTKGFISVHEYMLCYGKGEIENVDSPLSESEVKKHNKKDSKYSIRGGYRTQPLATRSLGDRENLVYPIIHEGEEIWPDKQWVWSRKRMEQAIANDEVEIFRYKGKWSVRSKQYLKDEFGVLRRGKPLSLLNGPYTQEGTKDIRELFEKDVFDFPKPKDLLKEILNYDINEKDNRSDIILDFFAGSCPLAQAVMQLNAEDGGNRKYICVQLAEACDEKSEAFKAGYKTIADIGKERIRRAAKKIEKENKGKLDFDDGKLDLGFKVFKLEESNFKEWRTDVKTADELKKQMFSFIDNVKADAVQEDILYELILKTGLDLNVTVEAKKANGKQYFVIDGGAVIICLEDKLTKSLIEKISKIKPEKFICLDRAFGGNDQLKTNTALQMEADSIEFKVI